LVFIQVLILILLIPLIYFIITGSQRQVKIIPMINLIIERWFH